MSEDKGGCRVKNQVLRLDELNQLDRETFVARLRYLFEDAPWVLAAAWEHRPFAHLEDLYAALCAALYAGSPEQHEALIRAHPELAGRDALSGAITPESAREQAMAGLNRLDANELAQFQALNQAYRERFGFPFVICVREHTREEILAALQSRLANSRQEELRQALHEITRICWFRLVDTVSNTHASPAIS
jgi:OHCU decarboxylase